jgi:hypothetical protein
MASSLRLSMIIAAGLAFSAAAAQAQTTSTTYHYKSARRLYDDCAAPAMLKSGVPTANRERCTGFLTQALNAWNLTQENGVCSAHSGKELPDAYVAYWKKRGLGVLKGEFRSAEASANDFLNSQKQRCPDRPRQDEH